MVNKNAELNKILEESPVLVSDKLESVILEIYNVANSMKQIIKFVRMMEISRSLITSK